MSSADGGDLFCDDHDVVAGEHSLARAHQVSASRAGVLTCRSEGDSKAERLSTATLALGRLRVLARAAPVIWGLL